MLTPEQEKVLAAFADVQIAENAYVALVDARNLKEQEIEASKKATIVIDLNPIDADIAVARAELTDAQSVLRKAGI